MEKETRTSPQYSENATVSVSGGGPYCLLNLVRTLALSVIFTLSFLSTKASAQDYKTYPGSMCVKWQGPEPTISFSSILNPSSSEYLYVDCPLIVDVTDGHVSLPYVVLLDQHYSKDVRCSINSAQRKNSTWYGYWGSNQFSEGNSTNKQEFLWYKHSKAGDYGIYYFSCRIPPTYNGNKSAIISYGAGEE